MLVYAPHLANAFLITAGLILLLQRAAADIGLVDAPAGRKRHEGAVPVIGGLAIYLAFLASFALWDWPLRAPIDLCLGLTLLVAVGLVDDRVGLGPRVKLAAQVAAALLLVVPAWRVVEALGLPGGGVLPLGPLALPLTAAFVVGLVNAYNMLDGLDGLAGGAAVAGLFWLTIALDGTAPQAVALVLLCATLGFLVFNARHRWRSRAAVFLGDAGSTMLGAAIAWLILAGSEAPGAGGSLVALAWVAAIPAIDTLSLIVRRLAAGASPLVGDRRHIHHLLVDRGVPHARATGLIVAATFATGGIGVAGARLGVSDAAMLAGLAIPALLHGAVVVGFGPRHGIAGARTAPSAEEAGARP